MRTLFTGLALAAVLLVPLAAAAEPATTFAVGDPRVDGSRLQPYDNAWIYSATKPDGTVAVQGIWTDHFVKLNQNGRAVWRRLQGMTYTNHIMSSVSNTFDAKTCEPLTNDQYHPDNSVLKRVFTGRHVATTRIAKPGDAPVASEFDLSSPVFDYYGGAYGVMLSCLPLEVGMTGSFPAVDETEDKPQTVTFKVLRRETVHAGLRGDRETLVVLVDKPGDYSQTYWLSKDAPYVIALEVAWADHHAVARFDML